MCKVAGPGLCTLVTAVYVRSHGKTRITPSTVNPHHQPTHYWAAAPCTTQIPLPLVVSTHVCTMVPWCGIQTGTKVYDRCSSISKTTRTHALRCNGGILPKHMWFSVHTCALFQSESCDIPF
jgi:hypothetical protein